MEDFLLISIDNPFVQHHCVQGQYILPGLAYIDIIYQLFRENGYDYTQYGIRHLSVYRPLMVTAEKAVQLHISCREEKPGRWDIQITGNGQPEEAPLLYLTAEMHIQTVIYQEKIDIAAISQYHARDLSATYDYFSMRGLVHSSYMRAEGMVYDQTGTAWMHIKTAAAMKELNAAFICNPILIDGSGMAVLGLLHQQQESAALFLPLSFEEFYISASLQEECWVRCHYEAGIRKPELINMTLEFFNGQGEKTGVLKGFVCKQVRAGILAPVPQVLQPDISWQSFLKTTIAARLGKPVANIAVKQDFYELGLDSPQMLEVIREIGKQLDHTLSPTLLFEYTNISTLADFLQTSYDKVPGDKDTPVPVAPPAADSVQPSPVAATGTADIAIIAVAGRYPGAMDIAAFWENLKAGKDCVTPVPAARWDDSWYEQVSGNFNKDYCYWGGFIDDVDKFDPAFFNIAPREATIMDPMQRLFLESVWQLFEGSGYTPADIRDRYASRVGVYVGAMYQQYPYFNADVSKAAEASLYTFSAIANRVSHFFDLQGPSMAIDSMCSSSLSAIHAACEALRNNTIAMAVAGGVNLSIHPGKYLGLTQQELAASSADSRSFGNGDGYIPAEGVGAVLLKRLDKARADGDHILAVIRGCSLNHSGKAGAFLSPGMHAQIKLMEENFAASGVRPDTIGYVEASANGAPLGDAIELTALNRFYKSHADAHFRCPIGAVKSNMGHAEAASGMAQLTKVILQLYHRQLVPSLLRGTMNPDIDLTNGYFYLQRSLTPWEEKKAVVAGATVVLPRRATISSYAAGGANAHLILEEYITPVAPAVALSADDQQTQLFVFSAKTAERLNVVVRQMKDFLQQQTNHALPDIAYALQQTKVALSHRLAILADNRTALLTALAAYLSGAPQPNNGQVYTGVVEEGELPADIQGKDLHQLAQHWVRGGKVSLAAVNTSHKRTPITLPAYPFERNSYWLPTADVTPLPVAIPAVVSAPATQQFIQEFIATALGCLPAQLPLEEDMTAYGVTSLLATKLLRAIDRQTGVKISRRELLIYSTIAALAAQVERSKTNVPVTDPTPATRSIETELSAALELYREGTLSMEEVKAFII
ncbi:beta-ketoacyl synthase N-terminal-like domain-containing protein [Chitinophaga nivalis]|uniref:Phosphopantetheine-binding protein n=1 Tax=Chitinophaga nivalis TaxID=2991709 RepID=A0ABT3IIW8_9BACT|nr:beta-ketoacyl synthase N-terminal-like domain-containing protein [Chitinophaga nivalis]MCW3466425.1 phosphopantetheine-binding protein [Chitinophaga nivalis]MCW3483884.1 phosphopantetheine-binding protein [Chitinophaga nivalis]